MRILDKKGQGLTEYLILLLLISVVSIAATKTLGATIKSKLQEARNHINSEITLDSGGSKGDVQNLPGHW